MDQSFPLRTTFFRGPPLNEDVQKSLVAAAKENAASLVQTAYNENWRYVPPEKDGVQYRKDTSNMLVSCRFLRCATVVKCLPSELSTLVSQPTTDGLRSFLKKFLPRSNNNNNDAKPDDADESVISVKWGVVDIGMGARRDLVVVDLLGETTVPNTPERAPLYMWCVTSTDGNNVGCLSMKESHNLTRTTLTRAGLFWRQTAPDEVEVVFCGSFKSKAAKAAGTAVLLGLGRLSDMVEELRLSYMHFAHHSTWVRDNERTSCLLCMRNFHTLRRKHHCRMCGEVICSDCSVIKAVDLPVVGANKVRLCKVCCVRAKTSPVTPQTLRSVTSLTSSDFDAERLRSTSSGPLECQLIVSPSALSQSTRSHRSSEPDDASSNFDNFSTKGLCGDAIRMSLSRPDEKAKKPEIAEWRRKLDAFEPLIATGTSCESMFALLCDLACETLSCPIAIVCLLETDADGVRREKLKSTLGLENHALKSEIQIFIDRVMDISPIVVLDAGADPSTMAIFDRVPVVRFFAGCPIFGRNAQHLGYICVADTRKRTSLGSTCAATMERLATLASATMEERLASKTQIPAATHPLPPSGAHATTVRDGNGGYHTSPHSQAEIRMRDLLLKTLMTQQQIAAANGPYDT
ncbi:hypothetical protein SPRG_08781 [Saprolegnia parasitica CBS 223.65]|uniref:FYVE-type domain-containing protein n=1 Tax=Saprolegnia parasitica (strain CBS 223.65) TaxID=695850 RepID=A0A067CG94_SAPPC|nr:hypothetical protein SPRG_08781 [Saprolegnia parasitica CBS 223.65]KDO25837.1 hypothetical protein SPRG_08781 [Saprolegnia parasitica CBS 223.65]|eukprot:XP_012203401.1 hypothetical protein SPRG_08781 [Saprolegnia parasitica CBS 223.65]